MALTLKAVASMCYAYSWIQAWFPPLEENDEVVPHERSLPVLSAHLHLFEAVLSTLHNFRNGIFKENFLKQFETFKSAVNNNRVEVEGKHEYEYFYIRTLQKYEQSTFLATTFPNETYLWGNPRMKDAFARFIVNGGKIIRVFFLKDAQELALPEIQAILCEQYKMKVDVYTIDWSLLTNNLRHVFVVESKGRLAWYASVPITGNPINRVLATATTNNQVTKMYIEIFKEICERAQKFIS